MAYGSHTLLPFLVRRYDNDVCFFSCIFRHVIRYLFFIYIYVWKYHKTDENNTENKHRVLYKSEKIVEIVWLTSTTARTIRRQKCTLLSFVYDSHLFFINIFNTAIIEHGWLYFSNDNNARLVKFFVERTLWTYATNRVPHFYFCAVRCHLNRRNITDVVSSG